MKARTDGSRIFNSSRSRNRSVCEPLTSETTHAKRTAVSATNTRMGTPTGTLSPRRAINFEHHTNTVLCSAPQRAVRAYQVSRAAHHASSTCRRTSSVVRVQENPRSSPRLPVSVRSPLLYSQARNAESTSTRPVTTR